MPKSRSIDITEGFLKTEDIANTYENLSLLTDVSKLEDGNRATRKSLDRAHIANASPDAMTIKLADLISNTASIMEYDANFAKVYLKEKKLLLEVLTKGNDELMKIAKDKIT